MIELNEIQFQSPNWLLLIPASAFLLIFLGKFLSPLAHWLTSFKQKDYRHPQFALLFTETTRSRPASTGLLNKLLYFFILTLLFLSLSQPYQTGKKLPEPPEHRDIVFLVDTSVSMVLRDYIVNDKRTDRITVMKNVLSHFIDQLKGNRIQIIAYSEKAFTLVPLTTDYGLLKFQAQRLEAASLTGRSTDLSNALLYALKPYQEVSADKAEARPVFVMLTDAHRPLRNIDPRTVASLIAEHGIHLHTIAIGAASYQAEDTEHISLIYHPTNFQLLEEIAKNGKGKFFWAKDADAMSDALLKINDAEKRSINAEPEYIKIPLYHWPLLLALASLVIIYLLHLMSYRFSRRLSV